MAYQDIPQPARVLIREIAYTRNSLGAAGSAIAAFFAKIGKALISGGAAQARFDQVQALQAKSDAELAKMGLKRDEIVHYVFRDMLHL